MRTSRVLQRSSQALACSATALKFFVNVRHRAGWRRRPHAGCGPGWRAGRAGRQRWASKARSALSNRACPGGLRRVEQGGQLREQGLAVEQAVGVAGLRGGAAPRRALVVGEQPLGGGARFLAVLVAPAGPAVRGRREGVSICFIFSLLRSTTQRCGRHAGKNSPDDHKNSLIRQPRSVWAWYPCAFQTSV
jgi:hypothetical protein